MSRLGVVTGPSDYPAEWETDVVLSDGSTAALRPIRPDDRDLIDAFHRRQSQESIYFRFFRYRPELSDKELDYFTTVDYAQRMAFVAMLGAELVAVARYETWESPDHPGQKVAEVAFFVDDQHHGKGLATIMLEYLAAAGRHQGFDRFTATVLPENVGMLRVFRKAGFDVATKFADGVIEVDLGIEVTDEAAATIAGRDRRAQARSVARIVAPTSVAVVGAGRTPGSVGHDLLASIRRGGFVGPVWAVNPAAVGASDLGGVELDSPVVGSLRDLDLAEDASLDLVVVAVPAPAVEGVLDDAIAVGASAMVIVSVGFSEAGPDGAERERRLVERARANGLRLLGPNSFGLVNTDPAVALEALFVRASVRAGSVGLASQSGPLGAGLLNELSRAELGVSSMVALGNRADVSVNDLLAFWAEDERTTAVALYLENFGNLRNFSAVARHLSRHKAVIAVRPADDELAEFLEHAGVILVDRVADLVQQSAVAVGQPVPSGNRVAVVGNTASVARLAAAACRRAGLEVVTPAGVEETTVSDVVLVADADTLALPREAEFAAYEEILVAAAVDPGVDAVLAAFVPTPTLSADRLGELLTRVDRAVDKPMVATGLVDPSLLHASDLPVFVFPEEAALALGRAAGLGRWRAEQADLRVAPLDGERAVAVQAAVHAVLDRAGGEACLVDPEAAAVLDAIGLEAVPHRVVDTAAAAADAAEEIGYPVVLKAGRLDRRSAGEGGGAAIDLRSADEVAAAFERMAADLGPDVLVPAIVQAQAPMGHHLRIELVQDPDRGGWIDVGIGGFAGVGLEPQASLVLPTSSSEIDALLDEPWVAAAVEHPDARAKVAELLADLARTVGACPELAGLRADPVLVRDATVSLVDASVSARPWHRDLLAGVRHLD